MENLQQVTGVAVAAAPAQIVGVFGTFDNEQMSIFIKNTGANPLTGFEVLMRNNPNAGYAKVASITADFTTPSAPVLFSKTDAQAAMDPTALAAATNGLLILNVKGIESVQIKAASTVGTTISLFVNGG